MEAPSAVVADILRHEKIADLVPQVVESIPALSGFEVIAVACIASNTEGDRYVFNVFAQHAETGAVRLDTVLVVVEEAQDDDAD